MVAQSLPSPAAPELEPDATLAAGRTALDAFQLWTMTRLARDCLRMGHWREVARILAVLECGADRLSPSAARVYAAHRADLAGGLAVARSTAFPLA